MYINHVWPCPSRTCLSLSHQIPISSTPTCISNRKWLKCIHRVRPTHATSLCRVQSTHFRDVPHLPLEDDKQPTFIQLIYHINLMKSRFMNLMVRFLASHVDHHHILDRPPANWTKRSTWLALLWSAIRTPEMQKITLLGSEILIHGSVSSMYSFWVPQECMVHWILF